MNGDGYIDVAVGSPQFSSNAGRAYVYNGTGTSPWLPASRTVELTQIGVFDLGRNVGTSGDSPNR